MQYQMSVLQITIVATDQRPVNEKTATTSVLITVDLDADPYFSMSVYRNTINESQSIQAVMTNIRATDNDLKVGRLFIVL